MNPVKFHLDQIQNGRLIAIFVCSKLTKYLKKLSFRMNIPNTNEYLFPTLYTCMDHNPPMNAVK